MKLLELNNLISPHQKEVMSLALKSLTTKLINVDNDSSFSQNDLLDIIG